MVLGCEIANGRSDGTALGSSSRTVGSVPVVYEIAGFSHRVGLTEKSSRMKSSKRNWCKLWIRLIRTCILRELT